MSSSAIVQKLLPASCDAQVNWNSCNVLRDDEMSYLLARSAQASGAYPSVELRTGIEQLMYLSFFKMAGERITRHNIEN